MSFGEGQKFVLDRRHPGRGVPGRRSSPHFGFHASLMPTGIPIYALRAPRSNAFCWAFQSFLDEVAHAANADPLKFRLDLLDAAIAGQSGPNPPKLQFDPKRMRAVVARVAEMSGWDRQAKSDGVGMGVAFQFSHRGYFAEVARVRVTGGTKVKIEKMWAAGDVGRHVINPSSAINQAEGRRDRRHGARDDRGDHVRPRPRRSRATSTTSSSCATAQAPAEIEVDFIKSDNSADRPRRAGAAAGRARDLQRDLRRDRQAHPVAAARQARLLVGVSEPGLPDRSRRPE